MTTIYSVIIWDGNNDRKHSEILFSNLRKAFDAAMEKTEENGNFEIAISDDFEDIDNRFHFNEEAEYCITFSKSRHFSDEIRIKELILF